VKSVAKKQKMKKAFTLLELIVSIALLAMVFLFAGMIFRVSINSYRTAVANAEIMQKLRAITDQLNADFKGTIWDPTGKINFGFGESYVDNKLIYTASDTTKPVRSDSIIFFATGDFQSTRQYKDKSSGKSKTVAGNVACIFYGPADVNYSPEEKPDPKKKILMRRQIIITPDIKWPNENWNALGEYYNQRSLAELIADPTFDPCNSNLMDRQLDLNDPNKLVTYMAKGVDNFTIQYVGGEYPYQGMPFNEWRPDNKVDLSTWPKNLYPIAFKFTFTLYDSKGVIKQGRTFTHIVYLGD
jgi:prepilin-type N-terminal cleavage/methylation domain-containing protein